MQKDPKVASRALGTDWISLVTVPSEEEELQFHVYNSTAPNWYGTCMGFFVVAPDATTATPFEWECYAHVEMIGTPISNYRSSIVDPIGAAAVMNAIKRRGAMPLVHDQPWQLAQAAAREIGGMSTVVN
jgi:hypothetical protein